MKCICIIMAGIFTLTCLKIDIAHSNNVFLTSASRNCPLLDDIRKLNFRNHGFEIKLLEILTKKGYPNKYYISNPGCKEKIMHFLDRTCGVNNRRPQIYCELAYRLSEWDIVEKYKILSPYQKEQMLNYFDRLYMDVISKDDEVASKIAKIDESWFIPLKEEYRHRRFDSFQILFPGLVAAIGLSYAMWISWDADNNFVKSALPFFWLLAMIISTIGYKFFSEAKWNLEDIKWELKRANYNTGLTSSEMKFLVDSLIEKVRLAYKQSNKKTDCIHALE